jgi:hypothetical protein
MADEKPEQTTADYDEWVASRAAQKQDDDETVKSPEETEDDRIARAVEKALAKERERVAATAPISVTPNHGGGVGVDHNEETWSQYDQELATRGEHPLQNQ